MDLLHFCTSLHCCPSLSEFKRASFCRFLTSPINMSLRSIMWDAAAPIRPRKCSVLTHRASLVDEWSPLLPSLILLDRGCRQEAQSSNRQQRHIWPQGELISSIPDVFQCKTTSREQNMGRQFNGLCWESCVSCGADQNQYSAITLFLHSYLPLYFWHKVTNSSPK